MEYAHFGCLHDFWEKDQKHNNTAWSTKVNMALQIASAMLHLAIKGVCHLSLDCDNVLLRKDMTVAITGFSLSGTSYVKSDIERVKLSLHALLKNTVSDDKRRDVPLPRLDL